MKVSGVVGMKLAVGAVCFVMLALIATIIAVPLSLVEPASIYLYSSNLNVTLSSLTSRTTTNDYCASLPGRPYLCGTHSKMLISYVADPFSVSPQSPLRPVRGPTGILIASSLNDLLSSSVALTGTLAAAGLGTTCAGAWTGMNSTGGASNATNCVDFTSSGGTLKSGSYLTTTQPWYSQTNAAATCLTSNCVICVCY